jgi:hypothetical protein
MQYLRAFRAHDEGRLLDRVVADRDDQIGAVDGLVWGHRLIFQYSHDPLALISTANVLSRTEHNATEDFRQNHTATDLRLSVAQLAPPPLAGLFLAGPFIEC